MIREINTVLSRLIVCLPRLGDWVGSSACMYITRLAVLQHMNPSIHLFV